MHQASHMRRSILSCLRLNLSTCWQAWEEKVSTLSGTQRVFGCFLASLILYDFVNRKPRRPDGSLKGWSEGIA